MSSLRKTIWDHKKGIGTGEKPLLPGALMEFFFLSSEVLLNTSLEAHPSVFCKNNRNVSCSGITV